MTDQEDKERYERNFENIFSKLNRTVTNNVAAIIITVLMGLWASMFGLIFVDQQNHKAIAVEQRIEVIRELGEVKTMIANIKR